MLDDDDDDDDELHNGKREKGARARATRTCSRQTVVTRKQMKKQKTKIEKKTKKKTHARPFSYRSMLYVRMRYDVILWT